MPPGREGLKIFSVGVEHKLSVLLMGFLLAALAVPVPGWAFNDTEIDDSPCTFINKGTVSGDVKLSCPGLSEQAVKNIEQLLQEHLTEQTRNLKQKNDHIDLLTDQIARLKQNREKALAENAEDQQKNPENPLLVAEREALEVFDLKKAAELREQYYQALKQEKQAKVAEMQTEMAREAFVSAERWEDAFNMPKALKLYQEAVEFKADYPEAWRKISQLARKIGDYSLALEAAESMEKWTDPEVDKWNQALAAEEKGNILVALGRNEEALNSYEYRLQLFTELSEANPDNLFVDRELSVSHNKVGDMHQASGDGVAALKAYEESLAIRKRLAELDPNKVEWQTDLVVSYYKLAQVQPDKQKQLLSDALTILKKLHAENKLDHEKQGWIPILEEAINE
jgi:tetratricopeptide (TPR) repeat protein